MHPDPQRQPGPPAAHPSAAPGYIPTQQWHGGPPPNPWAVPPAPVTPGGQPLAGFGDRLIAYVIDSLIVGLAGFVLACPIMIFAVILPLTRIDEEGRLGAGTIVLFLVGYAALFVLQFALSYLYFVEYQLRTGQTAGKRVMSLRVQPIRPDQALDRRILGRRYLVQHVAGGFVPFFAWLDGLWQLWDKPLAQTLHDKAAETVVAKVVQ
ncbi:RDD family protein [Asanoa iriomotensis]|uniref:RDD domain-containing protein n=1 Tax=Asanoa iriomotensis TaxID=234613 RepID=A0ABQ4C2B7_9ACTN|nr:RDD family protein [Asanoa iriomotensis]GIF56933.1 hypothetical protein Air01nite_30280 [Asanoa iriomotensis]